MAEMTREMMAIAIAQRDGARTVASRLAEQITPTYYDEIAQKLTDTYAEWLGISTECDEWEAEYEQYEMVCDIANEHLRDAMGVGNPIDEEEMAWREKIRSEEGYDEADEDMSTDEVREWAQDWCDTMGTDLCDRLFERVTEEMVAWANR